MTVVLFRDLLKPFKKYFQREGRHVLRFADHCRADGCQMEKAKDLSEEEATATDIYKVDTVIAVHYVRRIWTKFSRLTIGNCWRHTGLDHDVVGEEKVCSDFSQDSAHLKSLIDQLLAITAGTLQNLPKQSEEDVCLEDVDE